MRREGRSRTAEIGGDERSAGSNKKRWGSQVVKVGSGRLVVDESRRHPSLRVEEGAGGCAGGEGGRGLKATTAPSEAEECPERGHALCDWLAG